VSINSYTHLAASIIVGCLACNASVADDPFATVGMSGETMATAATSSSSEPSGESGESGDSGEMTGAGADGSTGDSTSDCNPPCDPMTAICEAGECISPGQPTAGQLVISEFMPNPELTTDDDGEWIELSNVGAVPVDIAGCVLYDSGGDEDVIESPGPIVVSPGERVVLAKAVDMAVNGGIAGVPYGFGTSYTLANGEDEIRLECGGAVVDALAYTDAWAFDAGVAVQLDGASLDATANDDPASWCAATTSYGVGDLGTPGLVNVGC